MQALPEPLRSQMLLGDFHAGMEEISEGTFAALAQFRERMASMLKAAPLLYLAMLLPLEDSVVSES